MLQSYEKSRAKQRKSFLFLPRRSKFAIFDGKVTKSREQNKENHFFFLPRRSKFAIFDGKVKQKTMQETNDLTRR